MSNGIIKTIKLKDPFEYDEQKVEEITFNKGSARSIRGLPGEPKMGHLLDVAENLSGWNKRKIDKLSIADSVEVCGYVGELLNAAQ